MKKETTQLLSASLMILLTSNLVWSTAWTALATKPAAWVNAQSPLTVDELPLGARLADPWTMQGLVPYGQYFRELDEYVSPLTGLLTVEQLDLSLPGRGIDTGVGRVYTEPPLFTKDGVPAPGYEAYAYTKSSR